MGLDDDLLTCLALERQVFFLYGCWGGIAGRDSTLSEMLSRLADQTDRHRASLWDLALKHDLTPPPRFEPALMADAAPIEQAKFTLRQAIDALTSLSEELAGYQQDLVERMRNEDEAQLRQLLILSPEPTLTVASARQRRGAQRGLFKGEPRWRPGTE